jgi:hypothetical protein
MTLKLCCEGNPTCDKSKEFLKKHDSLIRKQTLEEVLKEFDNVFGAIDEERQGLRYVFRKKLEQRITEMG